MGGLLLAGVATERYHRTHPVRAAGLTAAGLGIAFLAKVTAVLASHFFGFFALSALFRPASRRFGEVSLLVWTLLCITYLGCCCWQFEDAFYRFRLVANANYASAISYFDKPGAVLYDRLTAEPWRFFAEQGLLTPLLIGGGASVRAWRSGGDAFTRFWSLYAAALLLTYWFASTSWRFYNPLPFTGRLFMPFALPIFVLAADGVRMALRTGSGRGLLVWAWLIGATAAFALAAPIYKWLLLMAGLSAGLWLWPILSGVLFSRNSNSFFRHNSVKPWGWIWLLGALILPIRWLLQPPNYGYRAEQDLIAQCLANDALPLIGDKLFAHRYHWHHRFGSLASPAPLAYEEAHTLRPGQQAYLFFNLDYQRSNELLPYGPEDFFAQFGGDCPPLVQCHGVRLYRWQRPAAP